MGCRTRVMGNVNGPEITPGRGNNSFTSINLPRIAIKAKGDVQWFFEELEHTPFRKVCDRFLSLRPYQEKKAVSLTALKEKLWKKR